jgi:hypothetical protein
MQAGIFSGEPQLVTLIAAVRCHDGIAIAADSQETAGAHRCAVQKIAPRNNGNLHTLIVGSGTAELIDAFIELFYRCLPTEPIHHLDEFVSFTERTLREFHNTDVRLSKHRDKRFTLLVGACIASTAEFNVWVSKGIRLKPIGLYELIGCDYLLYQTTIQRMICEAMTIQQGILVGVHTIVVAKQSSSYVGGPISLALVLPNDIWREQPDSVYQIEERLATYERQVNRIFLACADTSISPLGLQKTINSFAEEVQALHKAHLDRAALNLNNTLNTPFQKLPVGTSIVFTSKHEAIPQYDSDTGTLDEMRRHVAERKSLWETVNKESGVEDEDSAPQEPKS